MKSQKTAGVSIATVSHVINKTRYVSPELIARVEEAMAATGYQQKVRHKKNSARIGKGSEIALVIPTLENTVFSRYASTFSRLFGEKGLHLSIHLSYDDVRREQHILTRLAASKDVAGVILAACADSPKFYANFLKRRIPFLCLERWIDHPEIDCILSEGLQAMYQGTEHLLKSGHESHRIPRRGSAARGQR